MTGKLLFSRYTQSYVQGRVSSFLCTSTMKWTSIHHTNFRDIVLLSHYECAFSLHRLCKTFAQLQAVQTSKFVIEALAFRVPTVIQVIYECVLDSFTKRRALRTAPRSVSSGATLLVTLLCHCQQVRGLGRRRSQDALDAEHRMILGLAFAVRLARQLVDA